MNFADLGMKEMTLSSREFSILRSNAVEQGVYLSYLRGTRCQNESSFFREISASLQFPWYFGENWPALDECICDLDWLNFTKLIIAIDNFDSVFMGDHELQNRLIRYLFTASKYWKSKHKTVEIWINRNID